MYSVTWDHVNTVSTPSTSWIVVLRRIYFSRESETTSREMRICGKQVTSNRGQELLGLAREALNEAAAA